MEVCERGDVSFFFRPTVQPADPERVTALGVQSFFLVLSPEHGGHRRLRIGRKRMPERSGERFWARVERVGSMQRVIGDQVEAEHYRTKTRGERYQPGARPLAHGTYAFLRHDDHVHLTYELLARDPEAPDELRLDDAGDYLVLFEAPGVGAATWTANGGPLLLDREGAEVVIVGHSESAASAVAHHVQPDG
jgi:hypothetical protein